MSRRGSDSRVSQTSGTAQNLTSVWGFAANNIYAVGAAGSILHWNGTNWSAQTSGTAANFLGVQGPDSGHVYAWADDNTLHVSHDGSTWSSLGSPFTFAAHSLFATTATDMWITFNGSRVRYSSNDGVSFGADVGNIGLSSTLCLFGLSPTDMFMGFNGGATEIMRWTSGAHDGSAWVDIANTLPSGLNFNSIWGTADGDMFAAGSSSGGAIYHSTDLFTTWTGLGYHNGALPIPTMSSINSVFGGNGLVYATGPTSNNHFVVMSYDRAKDLWSSDYDQSISNNARQLWVDSSTGYAVAVGDGGTIIKKG